MGETTHWTTRTTEIRWLVTRIEMCDYSGGDQWRRKLQQAWQDETGFTHWRDVPEVEVSNEEFSRAE
jgi:hypothetical protein